MPVHQGSVGFSGHLKAKLIKCPKAPLGWRIRNKLRWTYFVGWLMNRSAQLFSYASGIVTFTSELRGRLIRKDGTVVDYGVLGRRLVTTAFVNFLVDQLIAETSEWGDFKFHDSGVGVTAENAGDTDIETTDGEARATGSQTENAANIYESVGTITYTTTKAITEHGLFSIVTGGTLMDRTVFAVINVDNGDSIQFTYRLTANSGG